MTRRAALRRGGGRWQREAENGAGETYGMSYVIQPLRSRRERLRAGVLASTGEAVSRLRPPYLEYKAAWSWIERAGSRWVPLLRKKGLRALKRRLGWRGGGGARRGVDCARTGLVGLGILAATKGICKPLFALPS